MSFACDIPAFDCLLRAQFLYNLETHHGEFVPCKVIGADSVEGRAVGFDVLLENGALFSRLPVDALVSRPCKFATPLRSLQPWGAFSYDFECHTYAALRECPVTAVIGRVQIEGRYRFTFSWKRGPYAEEALEWKRGHFIELGDGQFAILPNNKILWRDTAWVTKPFNAAPPEYKTNSYNWFVE